MLVLLLALQVTFLFAEPIISNFTPQQIYTCGGEQITFFGSGFMSKTGGITSCIKGNLGSFIGAKVLYLSDTKIVCLTTPTNFGPTGFAVQIKEKQGTYTSNFVHVKARGDCLVSISSDRSCIVGGTEIKLVTKGVNQTFQWVVFTSLTSPFFAVVRAENPRNSTKKNEFFVRTPAWFEEGKAMIAISGSTGNFPISNQFPVHYFKQCLNSIKPTSYCVLGNTIGEVSGNLLPVPLSHDVYIEFFDSAMNFVRQLKYNPDTPTKFSFVFFPFNNISLNIANFRLRAHPGSYNTSVTNILPLPHHKNCITTINPTKVSKSGGDVIEVYGEQIPALFSSPIPLMCVFTDPGNGALIRTEATPISNKQCSCVVPLVSQPGRGKVHLQLQDVSTDPVFIEFDDS